MLLAGPKYCDWPVHGAGHHQDALAVVAGSLDPEDEGKLPVFLIPEPTNPHDPQAVMVRVGDYVVGYLPRDDCADFHEQFAALNPGDRPAVCMAYLGHGPDYGYYIKLGLDWPLAEADRTPD